MDTNEAIMKRAEKYISLRKIFMLGLAIGVILICSTFIGKYFAPPWFDKITGQSIRTIGFIIYIFCLFGNAVTQKRIKNHPIISSILDDEQAKANRAKMFVISYWVIFIALFGTLFYAIFNAVDAKFILLVLFMIGGISPPILFIILNSDFRGNNG